MFRALLETPLRWRKSRPECTPTHSHPSWNLLLDLRALMLQGSVILWPLVLTMWPLPMIQVKRMFSAWKGCSFIL